MHALGARGAGRERVEAPLVEGAYGIPHCLRSAPKVFGDLRRSVSAGARKQDLAPAHHEGIFGAQPGFEPFALLFRQIPDKNWRFHGGNYRPLHTTLSEDALENAQSVRAELRMGAGELNVTGGADALMEADFAYNVADWEPEVDYEVSGDTGELKVEQGSGEDISIGGEARNEWDLRLNDDVPIDLSVQMGAGESDLDLDSLTLTGLDLQMGAGATTVDLTGSYERDIAATIEGGVGEATVQLPSEIGVRVNAEGGLGQINLAVV